MSSNPQGVDIDIYGRAFDGVFGEGAEKQGRREALLRHKRIQQRRGAPRRTDFVERDAFGRCDPSIFGSKANQYAKVQTATDFQERRKTPDYTSLRAIMFPACFIGARAHSYRIEDAKHIGIVHGVLESLSSEERSGEEDSTNQKDIAPVAFVLESPTIHRSTSSSGPTGSSSSSALASAISESQSSSSTNTESSSTSSSSSSSGKKSTVISSVVIADPSSSSSSPSSSSSSTGTPAASIRASETIVEISSQSSSPSSTSSTAKTDSSVVNSQSNSSSASKTTTSSKSQTYNTASTTRHSVSSPTASGDSAGALHFLPQASNSTAPSSRHSDRTPTSQESSGLMARVRRLLGHSHSSGQSSQSSKTTLEGAAAISSQKSSSSKPSSSATNSRSKSSGTSNRHDSSRSSSRLEQMEQVYVPPEEILNSERGSRAHTARSTSKSSSNSSQFSRQQQEIETNMQSDSLIMHVESPEMSRSGSSHEEHEKSYGLPRGESSAGKSSSSSQSPHPSAGNEEVASLSRNGSTPEESNSSSSSSRPSTMNEEVARLTRDGSSPEESYRSSNSSRLSNRNEDLINPAIRRNSARENSSNSSSEVEVDQKQESPVVFHASAENDSFFGHYLNAEVSDGKKESSHEASQSSSSSSTSSSSKNSTMMESTNLHTESSNSLLQDPTIEKEDGFDHNGRYSEQDNQTPTYPDVSTGGENVGIRSCNEAESEEVPVIHIQSAHSEGENLSNKQEFEEDIAVIPAESTIAEGVEMRRSHEPDIDNSDMEVPLAQIQSVHREVEAHLPPAVDENLVMRSKHETDSKREALVAHVQSIHSEVETDGKYQGFDMENSVAQVQSTPSEDEAVNNIQLELDRVDGVHDIPLQDRSETSLSDSDELEFSGEEDIIEADDGAYVSENADRQTGEGHVIDRGSASMHESIGVSFGHEVSVDLPSRGPSTVAADSRDSSRTGVSSSNSSSGSRSPLGSGSGSRSGSSSGIGSSGGSTPVDARSSLTASTMAASSVAPSTQANFTMRQSGRSSVPSSMAQFPSADLSSENGFTPEVSSSESPDESVEDSDRSHEVSSSSELEEESSVELESEESAEMEEEEFNDMSSSSSSGSSSSMYEDVNTADLEVL